MNHLFLDVFVRCSLLLAVAAVLVQGVLWILRPRSPLAHRVAWGSVLFCGVMIFQMSLEIPWYDPLPAIESSLTEVSGELSEVTQLDGRSNGDRAAHLPLSSPPLPAEPSVTAMNWYSIGIGLWILGMLATIGLTAVSYGLLLLSMRRTRPAEPQWQRQWQRLLKAENVGANIPLVVHSRLGPMLCRLPAGYVVVVPETLWASFTEQERQAILRHELAHYQRGDVWTSLAARLLAVPHWYNPLAWWAVRKFEEGGEWACDQRLLDDPRQVPAFARALLAMIEPETNRVCTTAARGSSLSVRLRRLLTFQPQEDSVMKRGLLFSLLICLVVSGLLRVQLVARAQEESQPPRVEQAAVERVNEFARQLADEATLKEFKAALGTRAGQIVLRDHVSFFDDKMRMEAQTNALPAYFDKYYVLESDRYQLRSEKESYREQFLASVATFNEDVSKIEQALKELSTKVDEDSEVNRLLVRFMTHEASPTMLYIRELRERLRPDEGLVARLLGDLFVADGNGNYMIRAGRRPDAERLLEKARKLRKALAPIRAELKEYADEFSDKDDFHKQVKKTLAEPEFASFIAMELFGDEDVNIGRKIEEFFERLGSIAVDTADGLEITDQKKIEEIGQAFQRYRRSLKASEKLRAPLKAFAVNISDEDELAKGWKELLSSDVAIIRLGGEYEFADVDPAEMIRAILGKVLDESDDGKLRVRDDRADEVTEFVREMFRQFRSVRHRARLVDAAGKKVEDAELRAALSTPGGKFSVLYSIRNSLQQAEFDGFRIWVKEHFIETDNGLSLRDGGEEMVRNFIGEVAKINEELKKDDF